MIYSKNNIIILLLGILASSCFAQGITSPISPVIYCNGSGGLEVYWFQPGRFVKQVGNNTIIPNRGIIPFMADHRYSIFTRFYITPPINIKDANTYIINTDPFPDLPGDQFTPIRMSLKERVESKYYTDLWYDTIGLDAESSPDGAFIEAMTDLKIERLFDIYLALEWLPGYPTAPLIGVNLQPPYFDQYICSMEDSAFNMIYTPACAMVGLEYLNWHIDTDSIEKPIDGRMLNYQLLFSTDSADIYENGELIAMADYDSLTANFEITESGFLTIRAADIFGEAFSNPVFLNLEKMPNINIEPSKLVIDNIPEGNSFLVYNNGETAQELHARYNSELFVLTDTFFVLEPGNTKEIYIESVIEVENDTSIFSPLIFEVSGDYYPIITDLEIPAKINTLVENEGVLKPDKFHVSQPYPNPFNSSVKFSLSGVEREQIRMDIYNIIGQKLFSKIIPSMHADQIIWGGVDNFGNYVGSGIYFAKFYAENETIIRKVVLLK